MELLTIKNLNFTYPTAREPAVLDASLSLETGDFAVLCGATGCGKSTLLRLLKRELAPNGTESGEILLGGRPICEIPPERIGFVTQRPDEQIVTDKVYSELAFGPESMGLSQSVIARRVAEMASYFGIEDWYDRDVSTLSGGQKQLLNLASVMVMNPEILILDEPTSQLDPIATSDFLGTLKKLNRDFSLTLIIAEHRLEELIPMCDRLLVMDHGRLTYNASPEAVLSDLGDEDEVLPSMPVAARVFHALKGEGRCPLTLKEGRRFLEGRYAHRITRLEREAPARGEKTALTLKDVYFRYERSLPDVLRGLNLTVYENEILCVLGGNGSGKSTALACAAGLRKIYGGEIRVFGKRLKNYEGQSLYRGCLTMLPQDVQGLFLCNTVKEELADAGDRADTLPFDLSHLYAMHPYDLSGGEQQLLALAKVLATHPRILLLDEPTKGLDATKKNALIKLLRTLRAGGLTMLIVTHDVEFAALCADRCALFFRGDVVSVGTPAEFFSENSFYTTAASRMTKGFFENTVTVEDVVSLCLENGRKEST